MTTSQLIDTHDGLNELVQKLHNQDFIAVDTEFLRESTYFSRLCLVQVATPTTIACVDCIALDDLSPLTSVLLDPTITKVLHSARQDYEIFAHLTGKVPGPVFDTQIAADLCGLGDQGGFAAVVSQLLSVDLDKSHTRTDWSRRPLSDDQLKYAADDVRYLVPIYESLRETLQGNGRMPWQTEECEKLLDLTLYVVEPAQAWQRLSGLGNLQPQQFHTARLLAQWRETRAIKRDRPRGWVLRDDVLMRIATALPVSNAELEKIEGLPPANLRKDATTLLDIVTTAKACDEPLPDLPDPLTGQQRKLVSRLMKTVRSVAEEVGISPSTLASRRDVTALVRQNPETALLQGWRRETIGKKLLTISDET